MPKTISIDVYTFDELTDDAQRLAWENSGMDFSNDYSDEFCATLAAFEKIFDVKVYDYSVGGYSAPRYRFVTAGAASDAECIPYGNAQRVARFVWNNYAEYISKGKYYSTRFKWIDGKAQYKTRRSKIFKSFDACPLTGVICDYAILQPVVDCLHYKRWFGSYKELIAACLENFFDAWAADIEYRQSMEYFAETAECNEWYFTADGEFYKGA